jgi:hypothetical protein
LSSGDVKDSWEGAFLGVELTGLEAVMEATEEPVERMALGCGMANAGGAPLVVVGTGSGRGT